jgi:hypothetical protein
VIGGRKDRYQHDREEPLVAVGVPQVPQGAERPGSDQQNQLVHVQEVADECARADQSIERRVETGSTEAEQRIGDDRDDHRQDPVAQIDGRRARAVPLVQPRQHAHDHHCRPDEAHPGDDQTAAAGSLRAEMDCQLGGVRTRNEIGGTDEVQELAVVDPTAAAHDFVAHHRDVRSRAAEAEHSQPQEYAGDLPEVVA